MLVSIVAATHNDKKDALDFLESVNSLNVPTLKTEIIIVDNGSTDGTIQLIKKNYPRAKLIELKSNLGAPHALNIGFKKAKGEYIFKCDSDVILEKDCLKKLLNFLKNHPEIAIVGPKNYFKDLPQKIAPSAGKFNFWLGKTSTYPNLNKIIKVDYLQGCAILFSKKLIKSIGYLDEGFGLWLFDDQDFCTQASRKGFDIIYCPMAKIWHSTTLKTNARPKIKLEQWYKNKLRFTIKNANILQIFTSLSLQLLSIPYYALFYRDGTAGAIINGFWWNIKNLNKTLHARNIIKYEPTSS